MFDLKRTLEGFEHKLPSRQPKRLGTRARLTWFSVQTPDPNAILAWVEFVTCVWVCVCVFTC